MSGGLQHIEIPVFDLKRTEEFWSWLFDELGYKPWQGWQRGMSWKKGDTAVVFVRVDPEYKGTPFHRRPIGPNHLAFRVESREKLERVLERLRAHGIPLLDADAGRVARTGDKDAIYFEDPDRIKVEIFADASPEQ